MRQSVSQDGIKPGVTVWSAFRRLAKHGALYKAGFIFAMVLLAARMVVDIGFATVQQLFIDTITDSDMDGLMRITTLCAVACAVILICLIFQHYFRFSVHFRMTWDLKARLFDRSNRLPFQTIQEMHSGDLSSRNNKDAASAMNMVGSVVYELLYNLLLTLVSFIYLARMDVWIALLALGSGPVVFFCSRFFDRRLRKLSQEIFAREAGLRALLQEVVQGMTVVRAFGMEEAMQACYVAKRTELAVLQQKRTVLAGLLWQTSAFINNAIMIICSGLIAYSSIGGGLTAGGVLAFVILIGRVQWPFVNMSQTWGGVQESLGAADRVFEILDMPVEGENEAESVRHNIRKPVKAGGQKKAAVISGTNGAPASPAIRLRNVHFTHTDSSGGSSLPLFSGLDLTVSSGETVAIVGPSGSGKSTLVRLCCGLYKPDQGNIEIGGLSLKDQLEAGRRLTTYVPQIPYLFSGTVKENISFGTGGKSESEIRNAAILAGADEFIMRLPDGYDSWIGEHGTTLSGGQKQRLAIARAFLREAPLLILDEATSALDNESEHLVQRSLDRLMKNRTTLVVAHRLSTVKNADRILVMDRGRIVEDGTHEQLMEREGLYAKLYRIQFRESAETPDANGAG